MDNNWDGPKSSPLEDIQRAKKLIEKDIGFEIDPLNKMENIRELITKAVTDFELFSGKQPNAIYLGLIEHTALMSWYEADTYEPGKPNKKLAEFMGIKVYRIAYLESHLGIGIAE